MAADGAVASVLHAIHLLDGRRRGATRAEIAFLAPMPSADLDLALTRAMVGGWVIKIVVVPNEVRAGTTGDTVYRLTEMGRHSDPPTVETQADQEGPGGDR